jgi:dipeptidyl aminopeptidase/acylaminoacyl peptidase
MGRVVRGVDEVTRRLLLRAIVAIVAPALLFAPPCATASTRSLTLTDLRGQVTLLDPQISPDGTQIALIVRRADFARNRYRNELVLVDARSGTTHALVRERDDVSWPRWSPDGGRLAYLATPAAQSDSKQKPAPQLYVLSLAGGEPAHLTTAPQGVTGFAWRRDGAALAYLAPDASPDQKRIDAHDDWFEVGDVAWTTRFAAVPTQLWTIGADGSHPHRLTAGTTWSYADEPSFSRDGATIFATRTPVANGHYRRRTVVAIGAANGRVRALTSGDRSAEAPVVSPDGRVLAYGAEHPEAFSQREIFVTSPDGSGAHDATVRLDRDTQFALFAPHDELIVGAYDRTRDRLFALAPGAAPRALPLGEINLSGAASIARDGTLAFVGVAPLRPAELYLLTPHAAAPRRLTAYNAAVAARALGRSRSISWRSADGFRVTGVLTEPVGFTPGRRYPLVVVIHGGPTSTSTDGFSALPQLMAARGWLVFQPNYRGSDDLGHRFAQATVPRITSSPARDVLDGVDAVERMGIVDRTRIGVSGWSEGGLLTSWLIGHDHRWRAAFSGAAVNDWVGYADLTDAQDFTPSFIGAAPWTSERVRALYEAESPLTYAAAVRTPTLIVTDAGDYRVPTPLSYEFYHAIRAAGAPVELVVIPVNGHFPSDPLHREDVNRRWVTWFAERFGARPSEVGKRL